MAEIGLRLAGVGRGAAGVTQDRAEASTRARFALIGATDAPAIARDWAALAKGAQEENSFFHPDFVVPAMRAFGGGVRLATVRAGDGRLIGLAPATGTRLGRLAPAARLWSHEYGPLGVPLVDREQGEAAVSGLVAGLAVEGSLVLPDMPLDGPVAALARLVAGRAGRPIDIIDSHNRAMLARRADRAPDLRADLPTRRRKEFARQMRRLADLGSVTIVTAATPEAVTAGFEEFLVLEAAGWKGRARTALASSSTTAEFARAVVRGRAATETVRIVSLRLDGAPIAAVVCFVEGATAYSWKIAHDARYARFSPGAQLMLELAERLFADDRIGRVDSCAAADHPMIDHLWQDRLRIGTIVIGPVGGGFLHRLGLAGARAELKARAAARRVRARLRPKPDRESAS